MTRGTKRVFMTAAASVCAADGRNKQIQTVSVPISVTVSAAVAVGDTVSVSVSAFESPFQVRLNFDYCCS